MAAPFTRWPSRSTRGTTVEIFVIAESHRHCNRGRATASSPDLIELEDPNREPQSSQFVAAAPVFSSFVTAALMISGNNHTFWPHPNMPWFHTRGKMKKITGTGHHNDAKTRHQICNAVTRSTMAAPFTRWPSRSTRGTTVEIFVIAESHRHCNRGRATASSPDLIELEDPNREPQSSQFVAAAPVFSSFVTAALMISVFDEGFFLEWGKSLVIGTNYCSDLGGNVLNIKFDENLVVERKFRGVSQILGFYNLNACVTYALCFVEIGRNQFIHKIFSPEVVEMVYRRDSVGGFDIEHGVVNDLVVSVIPDNVVVSIIPDNASHISDDGLVKYLTYYDVRTSSLV
ncbi:hypothetical protein DEO72_LG1g3103 [Vigna unguiculata]|uniref:Uncharacterized protein n=1 Tax=Vigna unguiculata TaxID=3917 RepID=A0A4D6KXY2_VIGUN|nr:hypothetical protein DEO72_LG1g3103 [Vigna unguiculata]